MFNYNTFKNNFISSGVNPKCKTLIFLSLTKTSLKVEYFTDDRVTVATLDTTYLAPWNQRVLESISAFLSIEEGNHDVMILVTMPKGKPAFVEISSRPMIKKEMKSELDQIINIKEISLYVLTFSLSIERNDHFRHYSLQTFADLQCCC